MRPSSYVIRQSVARQVQGVDRGDDITGVQSSVLIGGVSFVDFEFHGSRYALRKI